ncbi:MAG: tripartite tricarboxylate transporter substrate binding protein [Variovorax sp.]|nr:tripartite tricarboxylate transporter substrate binding protein [Variovorax sp.]
MPLIQHARAWLCLAALAFVSSMASAQAFPQKPIRWIVGYPAGAASDFVARTVADAMSHRLGQPVIIDNRPGSSGIIAADLAAKSAPDGYTLATADNGILIFNTALFKKLPYDPAKDFTPIGLMVRLPMLILSNPASPYASIQDVVEEMKKNPGQVSYATPGIGSPHNLAMVMFKDQNKLAAEPVHYRGGAPMIQDVLGRHVDLMVLDVASSMPTLNGQKVRALVAFSKNRLAALPDVPTTFETGLGDLEAAAWQGIVVPTGTPEAVRTRLTEALLAAMSDPGVRKKLAEYGAEATPSTAAGMTQLWDKEKTYWVNLIKSHGITAE